MKLIIDVPETFYKNLFLTPKSFFPERIPERIDVPTDLFRNGIPLPKYHGRLIDEKELKKHIIRDNCDEGCGFIDERDIVNIKAVVEAETRRKK